MKLAVRLLGWCALLGLLGPGCVYDSHQRCSPHEQLIDFDRCACVAGYVPGPSGCVPCAEHEEESAGACVCVKGYARPSDGEACAPIPETLGADCSADATCPDGPYPLCHELDGDAGYCTNACGSDDDCDGGYKCHQAGSDSYCRRPPVGYGDSCESDDDCAGGEATFCEVIQTHLCLVPCDASHTDVCFEGETCCDYAVFHPVCVPNGSCTEKGGTDLGAE